MIQAKQVTKNFKKLYCTPCSHISCHLLTNLTFDLLAYSKGAHTFFYEIEDFINLRYPLLSSTFVTPKGYALRPLVTNLTNRVTEGLSDLVHL